jgi:ADP-ribose pyrophosphatase YjhB (NUDIX family)
VTLAAAARYRALRTLGRLVTRVAATLTMGRMPPFVSASALVIEGQSLLVVVDPVRREPILPGGHLRWREMPEDAVVREVQEETGIRIQTGTLVAALAGDRAAGEGGVVRLIFTGEVVGGTLTSSGEGEAKWLTLQDVPKAMARDGPIVQAWLMSRWEKPVVDPGRAADPGRRTPFGSPR